MYKLVGLVLFSVCFTTIFARNDTILHGWHPESHERGTWSILWGCLATIFICTWSVLHLEVPPRSASDLRRLTLKIEGALVAIIAPEYILTEAINDTLTSIILKKKLNRRVNEQERGETDEAWSLTHVRFMLVHGFAKTTDEDDVWNPLDPEDLSNIHQERRISKEELKSRSMTDWIANTLALFQISWFGTQLLVRRIQHLHISAVEILTLAFIVCSIFTFILCWPLPQNVAYPVVLSVTPPEAIEIANPLAQSPSDGSGASEFRASSLFIALERVTGFDFTALGFAGGVLGAVHCLAWNSTFPTSKERLAWRVCSVATTALPITALSIVLILEFVLIKGSEVWENGEAQEYIVYPFLVPYVIARLTLIALALASLRAVPADVFQTTDWNNIIPHVGL